MSGIRNINLRKKSGIEIPERISNYMKKYFEVKNLYDIKRMMKSGQVYFKVDVTTEKNIYRLRFNAQGFLMEKVMEPLFDSIFDETGVGD
ncbi:MAG TPA: hypothetical protein VI757_11155 [Bacteroidia bacterium]|nr:hypothetical protein [Bacteroidia bacterium]